MAAAAAAAAAAVAQNRLKRNDDDDDDGDSLSSGPWDCLRFFLQNMAWGGRGLCARARSKWTEGGGK
jgi:hypothetical protein